MFVLRSLLVFLLILLVGGCAKYTGGGWITSDQDGAKANFGFMADSCLADDDGIGMEGNFTYHDRSVEPMLKIKGDLTGGIMVNEDMYCVGMTYVSQGKGHKGEMGYAEACMIDNGEGHFALAPDWVMIEIFSGPFEGYYMEGEVHGNIQSHECPDFDD